MICEKPILFIHGSADDYVPFYMQKELYDACSAPKEYLVAENAVHARSYYTNPELYNEAITEFMQKNRINTNMHPKSQMFNEMHIL